MNTDTRINIGKRFGKLVIIAHHSFGRRSLYVCRCDCGNLTNATISALKDGSRISCGCYRRKYRHRGMDNEDEHRATIRKVEESVFRCYGYTDSILWGKDRHKDLAYVRHAALYIIKEKTDLAYGDIATLIGNAKSRCTVLNSLRVASALMHYADFRDIYENIKQTFSKL